MATYERATVVRAPLDAVWEFHVGVYGLEALTPDWLNLQVESTMRPADSQDTDGFAEGSEVRLSVQPFGVGPRRSWTSRIRNREEGDDEASFEDEMVRGPFPEWVHTHQFRTVEDGTEIRDVVRYELPPGRLGGWLSPVGVVGLAPMFRFRHRRARELLGEQDE